MKKQYAVALLKTFQNLIKITGHKLSQILFYIYEITRKRDFGFLRF